MPKNKKYRDYVSIVTFKSKYIAVAVAAAIAVSLAVGSVMVYENRSQHAALLDTASADTLTRVVGELTLRAGEVARHVSDRVSDAVLRDDPEVLSREVETFTRDDTVLGVTLRDTAGHEIYTWRRKPVSDPGITRSASAPLRANVQTAPGIMSPQTVGEVDVEIRSRGGSVESNAARVQYDAMQRQQMRKALLLAAALGLVALAVGLALAWWAGRRVRDPISTLIRSADRIAFRRCHYRVVSEHLRALSCAHRFETSLARQ